MTFLSALCISLLLLPALSFAASPKSPKPTPSPSKNSLEDRWLNLDPNKKLPLDLRKIDNTKGFQTKNFEASKPFASKNFSTSSYQTQPAKTKKFFFFADKKPKTPTSSLENKSFSPKTSPDSSKISPDSSSSFDAPTSSFDSKSFESRKAFFEGSNQKNLDKQNPLSTDDVKQILNKK